MIEKKEKFYFRRPEVISSTQKAKKESFRLNLKPLKNIFYLAILIAIIYVVIFSSLFKVKQVEVIGVKSVEISDYLNQTLVGRNILLMRTGQYLRGLAKKFPILEEAELVRGIPSTIKITVKERAQTLVLCNIESCYEVDNQGIAYQKIPKPTDKIVLVDEKNLQIKENEKTFSNSFISFFLGALDEFSKANLKITEARMDETTFRIRFITSEGWMVIMDSSANLQNQISAVKQVLDKNKSDLKVYIDTRVEGVAYVK
jgi:cell division septal protein FtsQ